PLEAGPDGTPSRPGGRDQQSQTETLLPLQTVSQNHGDNDNGSLFTTGDRPVRSSGSSVSEHQEKNAEETGLQSPLGDSGDTTTSLLRDELLQLRSENAELCRVLRENALNESQRKARAEEEDDDDCNGRAGGSGEEIVARPRAEAKGHLKVPRGWSEPVERKAAEESGWERGTQNREGQRATGPPCNTTARQRGSQRRAGVRSRLPVPMRLSEPASTIWTANRPEPSHRHVDTVDPLLEMHLNHISEPDQPLSEGSEYLLSQEEERSGTPGSNFDEYVHRSSCSPTVSDINPEALGEEAASKVVAPGHDQDDSGTMLAQLELLHQECQEKESLITELEDKLSAWEELHAQLQEKDHLTRQYAEALQAAESTIAYLTACNLDGNSGLGSTTATTTPTAAALQRECTELHKTLQEKERLNGHLVEFLNMTGREISAVRASLSSSKTAASRELCSRLESALQQMNASLAAQNNMPWGSHLGPEQNANGLQPGRRGLESLDAECEEGTPSEASDVLPGLNHDGVLHEDYFSRQIAGESVDKDRLRDIEGKSSCSEGSVAHGEMAKCLSDCLSAAESAIASLAAHCTDADSSSSGMLAQTGSDLQRHLQRLQISLKELGKLEDRGQLEEAKNGSNRRSGSQPPYQELQRNILLLYRAFCDHAQRISDLKAQASSLQAEKRLQGEESETQVSVDSPGAKGLPGNIKAQQPERLQKPLKDKKKMSKVLEEKALVN
ncbi:hypothetical protein CRUP_014982, partial [Coryphaenoides rupestris]